MIAGKVSLHNQLILQNNDAVQDDGGALHLISFSQVFLEPGVHLDFVNNSGRYSYMFNCLSTIILFYLQNWCCNRNSTRLHVFSI